MGLSNSRLAGRWRKSDVAADEYHEPSCDWCDDPLAWLKYEIVNSDHERLVVVPSDLLEFMCTRCVMVTLSGCELLEAYRTAGQQTHCQ